jgi:hypothetical protein
VSVSSVAFLGRGVDLHTASTLPRAALVVAPTLASVNTSSGLASAGNRSARRIGVLARQFDVCEGRALTPRTRRRAPWSSPGRSSPSWSSDRTRRPGRRPGAPLVAPWSSTRRAWSSLASWSSFYRYRVGSSRNRYRVSIGFGMCSPWSSVRRSSRATI